MLWTAEIGNILSVIYGAIYDELCYYYAIYIKQKENCM